MDLTICKWQENQEQITAYIDTQWQVLYRSLSDSIEYGLSDNKVLDSAASCNILYLPTTEDKERVLRHLQHSLSKTTLDGFSVEYLPDEHQKLDCHGLLYLPHHYIVPGGRFNEMYGWDSFFIAIGLLQSGNVSLAKAMADNFIYQIEHYGIILNANRTYYLGRSQPPLFTTLILALYEIIQDKTWLHEAAKANDIYYSYWMKPPRLVESIGLCRYYVEDDTPIPESESGYYEAVKDFFRQHKVSKIYKVNDYYNAENDNLTPNFFRADRSLRMSGLDITNRFGPFGIKITDHIPIGLNSLLYKMEKDSAVMHGYLGNKEEVKLWETRAAQRRANIDEYLWEPAIGLFSDFHTKMETVRSYYDATAFYPLWAGHCSPQQAKRLVDNMPSIEAKGGILASVYTTGMQWDAPFGWAPHQYFVVHGLMNYGYKDKALELARKFFSLLSHDFKATQALFEKYDLRKLTSDIVPDITYGYKENVKGFGWTNAVYLDFLNLLNQSSNAK